MIKIYGTDQCRDCVACKKELDEAGVSYEFLALEELPLLKEFLKLRDAEPVFDRVKGEGVGIPCIRREDGSITFDWKEFL